MTLLTTHHLYPNFPDGLPTAGLTSVSLAALQDLSTASIESSKLFAACRDLGFFYLDLFGSSLGEKIIGQVEALHLVQQDFYALPHQVKDQYDQDHVDPFFAYRWTACDSGRDAWGRPGRKEMYNLRVDDLFGIRPGLPRHELMTAAEPLLTAFARNCRQVVHLLLGHLETHLELSSGTLLNLHLDDKPRGDFISLQHRAPEPEDETTVKNGEHTDFGSITMLFNWLGGLQIRDQSAHGNADERDEEHVGEWVYVKPVAGSCIINLADSIVKLTAGLLKSNVHRVAQAPGRQALLPRYSLVYFSHPNDDVELVPVRGGLVDGVKDHPVDEGGPITAADWVTRRSLGDLRGVYTYKGGLEWRDLNDAVKLAVAAEVES